MTTLIQNIAIVLAQVMGRWLDAKTTSAKNNGSIVSALTIKAI